MTYKPQATNDWKHIRIQHTRVRKIKQKRKQIEKWWALIQHNTMVRPNRTNRVGIFPFDSVFFFLSSSFILISLSISLFIEFDGRKAATTRMHAISDDSSQHQFKISILHSHRANLNFSKFSRIGCCRVHSDAIAFQLTQLRKEAIDEIWPPHTHSIK